MKLLKLIDQLQGFAETIEAPDDVEVKFAIEVEGQFEVLSIYEGKPNEIWIDLGDEE